jgi:hypothetical protein
MNRSFSLLLLILPIALAVMVWVVLGAIAGAITLALVLAMFAFNSAQSRREESHPWNRQRVGRAALVLAGLICIAWGLWHVFDGPVPRNPRLVGLLGGAPIPIFRQFVVIAFGMLLILWGAGKTPGRPDWVCQKGSKIS